MTKRLARVEAEFFFGLVTDGRMTLEDARELIAIPYRVRKLLEEAAQEDRSLAPVCLEAIELRSQISEKFEAMLAQQATRERADRQYEAQPSTPSLTTPSMSDSSLQQTADEEQGQPERVPVEIEMPLCVERTRFAVLFPSVAEA